MIHARMQRRRVMEAAMRRRLGMTPERYEELEAEKQAWTDWRGACQTCGLHLMGTLNQARAHECPRDTA